MEPEGSLYRFYKSPPLVTFLSRMNPVHTTTSYSLTSILILPSQLYLSIPSGLFSSGFPPESYMYSFSPPI
jgi:hypothetical protein